MSKEKNEEEEDEEDEEDVAQEHEVSLQTPVDNNDDDASLTTMSDTPPTIIDADIDMEEYNDDKDQFDTNPTKFFTASEAQFKNVALRNISRWATFRRGMNKSIFNDASNVWSPGHLFLSNSTPIASAGQRTCKPLAVASEENIHKQQQQVSVSSLKKLSAMKPLSSSFLSKEASSKTDIIFDITRGKLSQNCRTFIYGGKQCVAICATAIAYAHLKDPSLWQSETINNIVLEGNSFYEKIVDTGGDKFKNLKIKKKATTKRGQPKRKNINIDEVGFLEVSDLLPRTTMFDQEVCFKVPETPRSFLVVNDTENTANSNNTSDTLRNELEQFFAKHSYGIIISAGYGRAIFANTSTEDGINNVNDGNEDDDGLMLIGKDIVTHYYVFDSHRNDKMGMPVKRFAFSACFTIIRYSRYV